VDWRGLNSQGQQSEGLVAAGCVSGMDADLCIQTLPDDCLEEGAGPVRLKMGRLPWLKITVLQLGVFLSQERREAAETRRDCYFRF
jgi:hypothetical protein